MGKTLTEKILSAHLMEGSLEKGSPIGIRIDQTLTQDATGTMAFLQFEAMGLPRVKNELAVSYVDHNTIQVGFENADDHRYLQSVAASKGVIYSRPGNGICHQVHLERFGRPGATLLGSDSHTPTGGGLCMIAIGSGGLDVAVAMAGGAFHLIAPKVVEIRLKGKLRPWISAKDVILAVLEHFTTKGNVNCIFEYTGDGVTTLEVPERSTICNMGAEAGVTTSLFPSDENTRRFLQGHNRSECYKSLCADSDAKYDDLFEIDLSTLEARIALPHSPDNIVLVKDIAGKKVNQVLIGSCTNSSYVDMKKVADLLDGKVVHPSVSLGVAPGSREVFMMLANDGSLAKLITSGARILESACGFCIGNHQSPGTDEVSLRTNNRNFEGRSGTKSGQVYLVSPEVAVLGAITGRITDPLSSHGYAYPKVTVPSKFLVDDSMLIFPPKDGSSVEIFRGPNIGDPPKNKSLQKDLKGVVTIKVGDKITTDHIMPAGARLKYRSNIVEYSKYVFEPVDPSFATRCQKNQKEGRDNFIVAGSSYGQGSSREHAAICPMYLGVQAVIALSIERIHQNNLCNFGILPLTFVNMDDYAKLSKDDELVLEDIRTQIGKGEVLLLNKSKGISIPLTCDITAEQLTMLLAGGLLNVLKEQV